MRKAEAHSSFVLTIVSHFYNFGVDQFCQGFGSALKAFERVFKNTGSKVFYAYDLDSHIRFKRVSLAVYTTDM